MPAKKKNGKAVTATSGGRLPAKIEEGDYALFHVGADRVKSLVDYNVGNRGINQTSLDKITVPGTGVTTWTVETLRGDEEMKEIRGIIVAYREPRARWAESFDSSGGGTPPDCSSEEGLFGRGDPGGDCSACEFSRFGSEVRSDGSPGRGQACKQMRTLFVLRSRSLLPTTLVVPPSSLAAVESYFLRLLSEAYEFFSVETCITLEKDKNRDGIAYSKMAFTVGRELAEDEVNKVEAYAESLKGTFESHQVFNGEKE